MTNLLSAERITKAYGDRILFDNVSLGLNKGDKAALVARNGATVVGSVTAAGVPPAGFVFAEGVISFSGDAFDTIVLSSAARDFAVDNIDRALVDQFGQMTWT